MLRVSVIIPAFNAAALIGNAIGSAQAQTQGEIEIIVVDDASTDDTVAVVEHLAAEDKRLRLVRMSRNGGPGAARNAGLNAARGEWIGLLDADDRYHPQRLETLLAAGATPETQLVADNLALVLMPQMQRVGFMIPAGWLPEPRCIDAVEFVAGNMRTASQHRVGYGYLKPIIRRDFLMRTGIRYDDMRFSEDYIFVLRCLIAGARYIALPDALYDYAINENGLTTGHSADDLVRLVDCECALLRTPGIMPNAPLRDAMERHIRAVELALGWFRFAQAIKRRDPVAALSQVFQSPAHFRHIGHEGIRAIPRALIHGRRNEA